MLEELKSALKSAQTHLDDIVDRIEETSEEWSEKTADLWQRTKPRLQSMKTSVSEAADSLHTQSDEARLQAHLAAMDAHDQWQHLSKAIGEFARHTASKTTHELQHAELQAHLAAMDTRDFVNENGPKIRREFAEARDKVESASHTAARELEKSLEKLGDIWARTRH